MDIPFLNVFVLRIDHGRLQAVLSRFEGGGIAWYDIFHLEQAKA